MEDSDVIQLVEATEEALNLQEEIALALRDGFVNLASAKFSRGFSSSNGIGSSTFPEESEAWRTVDAQTEQQAQKDEDQVVVGEGLRRRRDVKKKTEEEDTTKGVVIQENSKGKGGEMQVMQRWLGLVPRGQLKESQRAFVRAVDASVRLAERRRELQRQLQQHVVEE